MQFFIISETFLTRSFEIYNTKAPSNSATQSTTATSGYYRVAGSVRNTLNNTIIKMFEIKKTRNNVLSVSIFKILIVVNVLLNYLMNLCTTSRAILEIRFASSSPTRLRHALFITCFSIDRTVVIDGRSTFRVRIYSTKTFGVFRHHIFQFSFYMFKH